MLHWALTDRWHFFYPLGNCRRHLYVVLCDIFAGLRHPLSTFPAASLEKKYLSVAVCGTKQAIRGQHFEVDGTEMRHYNGKRKVVGVGSLHELESLRGAEVQLKKPEVVRPENKWNCVGR